MAENRAKNFFEKRYCTSPSDNLYPSIANRARAEIFESDGTFGKVETYETFDEDNLPHSYDEKPAKVLFSPSRGCFHVQWFNHGTQTLSEEFNANGIQTR